MDIRLTPYRKEWATLYEKETAALQQLFGDALIRCEHFGSTSVVGMQAKPVIDILCVMQTIEAVDAMEQTLQSEGYEAMGEWGIAGRRYYRKGGDTRTHHIHFYAEQHPEIARHLVVRDYLRTHPHEIAAYNALKQELAARYDSTVHYSKAKGPFVQGLQQWALAWAEAK